MPSIISIRNGLVLLAVFVFMIAWASFSEDPFGGLIFRPDPDLVVTSVRYSGPQPTTTDAFTLIAVVKNIGEGTAEPSTLTLNLGTEDNRYRHSVPLLVPRLEQNQTFRATRKAGMPLAGAWICTAEADSGEEIDEILERNNDRSKRFTVIDTGRDHTVTAGFYNPELIIQELSFLPQDPTTQDQITFKAVVVNAGREHAGPFPIELDIDNDVEIIPVGGLDAHTSLLPIERQQSYAQPGTYNIKITADPTDPDDPDDPDDYGLVFEVSEDNNEKNLTFSVVTPPDLLVVHITHSPAFPDKPTAGRQMTFNARLRNDGGASADPFQVTLQLQGADTTTIEQPVSAEIAADTFIPFAFTWTPAPEQLGHYTATITANTATPPVTESNYTNNSDSITFDVCGPRTCDGLCYEIEDNCGNTLDCPCLPFPEGLEPGLRNSEYCSGQYWSIVNHEGNCPFGTEPCVGLDGYCYTYKKLKCATGGMVRAEEPGEETMVDCEYPTLLETDEQCGSCDEPP